MNILTNVTDYTEFLIKNKLSTNQFLLLYLLYTEKMIKSKSGKVSYSEATCLYKWQAKGTGWNQKEIEDLVKNDYVMAFPKTYTIDNQNLYGYAVDDLILTTKFSDIMFVATDEAFQEILELYPDTFNVNGSVVFSKSGDLEKLSDVYSKLIRNSIQQHDKMKEAIVFAKERGLCNMKLEKFLTKGVIDSIFKMMEEGYSNGRDV
jgi:hypothetical protein